MYSLIKIGHLSLSPPASYNPPHLSGRVAEGGEVVVSLERQGKEERGRMKDLIEIAQQERSATVVSGKGKKRKGRGTGDA